MKLAIRLSLLFLTLSLIACQAPIDKPSGWSSKSGEVRPGPKTGKAVLALLSKARQASRKGSLSSAESHLERALRIEPQNPTLWLYLAKLRLFSEKFKEAINLAKKSLALSSRGGTATESDKRSLQADCWRVIANSYVKLKNEEKAKSAQSKADSLSY